MLILKYFFMRKIHFFSLLLLICSTLVSCKIAQTRIAEDIPVDIVFEKWNIQFGQLKSFDITLKGKSKSGDAVEVSAKLMINQYDEYLLPMLTKLEEEDQFKDGNTGSGIIQVNKEYGNGKLLIQKVGSIATKNMEFRLEEKEVSVFRR
jgi:hypothetical protein